MCKVDVYPYLMPDGTRGQRREKSKCEVARRGEQCRDRQIFNHPLPSTHLPPSPSSTPRSATPNYRSGDESAGSSGSRGKRRSGVYIEVNGRPVYDTERRQRRSERIIVVESPPTPRTPPQAPEYAFPRTAPPSPSPLDSARRPIIVDERTIHRPSVTITTPPYAGHQRTPSNGSHHSRSSNTSDDDRFRWEVYNSTRARRPSQRELERERLAARIAAANAEINRRPAVPMPPTPPQRSPHTYIRPAVEVRTRAPVFMTEDAIRRAREAEELRRRKEEDEAQKARLRERMTPQRRASVGHGGRRQQEMYPDKVYRWE